MIQPQADREPTPSDRDTTAFNAPNPWIFGEQPLAQTRDLAPLLRRIAGLAMSLETSEPAVDRLIADLRRAEQTLARSAPSDLTPRIGADASPDQRVYLDHGRIIGTYNPCFPEYEIEVDGPQATGTVTFPVVFEGPPGLAHGGVIASFFDCVIQHHNCDVGQAGKTVTMQIRYRRPTPVGVALRFDIDRTTDERRITSTARLMHGDDVLSIATVEAVVGDRTNLPVVSPRRLP
jgi:acyl-coenzyme A thioesterase PaaI-like protein